MESIFLIWLFAVGQIESSTFMGPADVVVHYVEKCGDFKNGIDWDMKVSKKKREGITLTFNGSSPYKISDTMAAKVSVAINTNGGWKPNYYNINVGQLCSTLSKYEPGVLQAMAKSIKAESKCPLPKGYYVVKDYVVYKNQMSRISNVLPYAKFKLTLKVLYKETVLVCLNMFIESVQKKEKNG